MDCQLQLEIDRPASGESVWNRVLRLLEGRLGREAVRTWLRPARPVTWEAGRLVLAASTRTARDWIERKYGEAIRAALEEIAGGPGRLEVVVQAGEEKPSSAPRPTALLEQRPPGGTPAGSSPFAPAPLNEKYTFENFVVGPSNRFAHAAATAVAARPGRAYNPLFLYGETGLGKTHLLQAVGHQLRKQNPTARVAYVSGETFTSQFVSSLREGRVDDFKLAYRSADVWLVDDIQFVADKNSSREEFFHTFNDLYLTNRQIVLAADRRPEELRLMEERLRSRLASGLMAEVVAPELETRMAILERRAAWENADLPPEVVLAIAGMIESNVRALEAALIRVLALASLNRSPLTAELAGQALASVVREGRLSGVSLQSVQRAVCERFGIADAALPSARDQQTARARRVAMYLLRELGRHSLTQIGDLFGGKTHSTVVYACQKLEQEMKQDRDLAAAVRELSAKLKR
jgi:chromosomal replication initiator protein